MKKILIILLGFYCYMSADFQKLKVGVIDPRYGITPNQVKTLFLQIEDELESQTDMNLFDYAEDGKPIDFIYMPPSKKKQNIERSIQTLEKRFKSIGRLQERLVAKQKRVLEKENEVIKRKKTLDISILALNKEIEKFNKGGQSSHEAVAEQRAIIDKKQRKLKMRIDKWKQLNRNYEVNLNAYNQSVIDYRFKVKQYNQMQRKLEILVRASPEVQGVAKGYKQVVYKTFQKGGNTFIDKQELNIMEKIEIYGYESLAHLKAILAHELLHMVGMGHIDVKGALMNPILQNNQVEKLQLTQQDIDLIRDSF